MAASEQDRDDQVFVDAVLADWDNCHVNARRRDIYIAAAPKGKRRK